MYYCKKDKNQEYNFGTGEKCYCKLHELLLFPPETSINGGCLHPYAEPFLSNKNVVESYFPEGTSIQEYDFETCTGSNCFKLSPEGNGYTMHSFIDYRTIAPEV